MTSIEWARNEDGSRGETWNPVVGCSLVSPGCTNCYAMKMAARIERMDASGQRLAMPHYAGLTQASKAGAVWTGKVAFAPDGIVTKPLAWKKPRTIFVCSMADLFHEDVPDAWIDDVFAVMAMCPQHTFQVLTKRSARMRKYFIGLGGNGLARLFARIAERHNERPQDVVMAGWKYTRAAWPLPNVWLGTTCEDQTRADARIPELLATPAAVRFVSYEPALGPIDFEFVGESKGADGEFRYKALSGQALPWAGVIGGVGVWATNHAQPCAKLDWIICGGESGPDARPMHPDWARSVRDQCQAAGVPFFFKQWGAWAPVEEPPSEIQEDEELRGIGTMLGKQYLRRLGKSRAGRLLDGREWNDMPARAGTPATAETA